MRTVATQLSTRGCLDGNWMHVSCTAITRENLFAPLRCCIRQRLHLMYEDPQLVAHNSSNLDCKTGDSSVCTCPHESLMDGGFLCRRLDVNQWQAVLTSVTGAPSDKMHVIMQGRDVGGKHLVNGACVAIAIRSLGLQAEQPGTPIASGVADVTQQPRPRPRSSQAWKWDKGPGRCGSRVARHGNGIKGQGGAAAE